MRSTPIGRGQAGIETETVRTSAAPMEQPLLLAAADGPGGGIRLSPRGLEALRALPAPLHVVAALGPPDGGSVFLMEQLAGSGCSKGVEAGSWGEWAQRGRRRSDLVPSPPAALQASPAALGCGCGDARTPSGPTVSCCCCTPEDSSGARNRR